MNLADIKKGSPVRLLIQGEPGTGKTGALVSLINAGYKIRMLDFDGNKEPIVNYADPAFHKNVDIVTLRDKLTLAPNGLIQPVGIPMAFANGVRLMDQWRYPDPAGAEVDAKGVHWSNLGKSADWGLDTIVVLDSMTSMGDAAMFQARNMSGKTALNMSQPVWGLAIAQQHNFIKRLMDPNNPHHTIVISHVKIVGPKGEVNSDTALQKEIKEKAAELIETKLRPSALGWVLPQDIAKEFPCALSFETAVIGKHVKRRIEFKAKAEITTKLPAASLAGLDDLTIRDGLLRIFKALGHTPPVAS